MKQIKPEAFYDSLSLAHKLDNVLDGFQLEEIHLFSYFSSVLFLYNRNPISDWGYKFIVDSKGYPYAEELDQSCESHIRNGWFEQRGEFLTIESRGTDEYNRFKELSTMVKREKFLNAACTTSILVPYSDTRKALLNDSEIKKAQKLENKDWLKQNKTYEKFKEISEAVGVEADDLIIPAVTWVNYINEKEKNPESIDG